MTEKIAYTVLTGESYTVYATSEEEALAKFHVSQGNTVEADYEASTGFDFSSIDDDVEEMETLTEVLKP